LGQRQQSSRWKTQPLVLTLLFMTWCGGDSQAERFEIAKGYCQVCLRKRRGPGKTVQGFQKALARLPVGVLRIVATGVRGLVAKRLGEHWFVEGWVPIGCDGSRVECPRTVELEARLGQAGKHKAAPTLWVTALVHLRWGVPWAWRLGKGTASERFHLEQMLGILPKLALLVADAVASGVLAGLKPEELAATLVSLVSEDRGRERPQPSRRHFPTPRIEERHRRLRGSMRRFMELEREHGLETLPPLSLEQIRPAYEWASGVPLADIEPPPGADTGDVVKAVKSLYSLLRQMEQALRGHELQPLVAETRERVERDLIRRV